MTHLAFACLALLAVIGCKKEKPANESPVIQRAGYTIPQPDGYEIDRAVTDKDTLVLRSSTTGESARSTISIGPFPAPTKITKDVCRAVALQVAETTGAKFEDADVVDLPGLGPRCQYVLSKGVIFSTGTAVDRADGDSYLVVCTMELGDDEARRKCSEVLYGWRFARPAKGGP